MDLDDYTYHATFDRVENGVTHYKYGRTGDPIQKVPGRLLFANDPQRGLWHMLDIFDAVQRDVSDATLHITYDWERVFEMVKWSHTHLAERLWDCKARIAHNPNIVSRGALTREEVIREQLECQVHVMPSDPLNVGSQIHGITQMECAAAGCALVLSDIEAFPEVFGEGAEILPVPGWFDPRAERRWDAQDWAEVTVELIKDPIKWAAASRKARALAERNTWDHVVENFDAMLKTLSQKAVAVA